MKLTFCPQVTSKNDHSGKYFSFNTIAIKVLDLVRILHPYFPNKALFKASRYLMPRPPLFLASHTFLHATKANSLSLSLLL